MKHSVYLLPGKGNTLDELGGIIAALEFKYSGRELTPPFSTLYFPKQLEVIKADLAADFWRSTAKLIGHSYGGYLLLHALAEMEEPFPGDILLFSPVLGAGTAFQSKNVIISRPPRANKLLELAETSMFPAPQSMAIHTGANDLGCDPKLAQIIGESIPRTAVTIVPEVGHQFARGYYQQAMSKFLRSSH